MKMTDTWKVSYMMKGTSYQEHVEVGVDLSHFVAAIVAMERVQKANDYELTDMLAQKI